MKEGPPKLLVIQSRTRVKQLFVLPLALFLTILDLPREQISFHPIFMHNLILKIDRASQNV